MAGTFSKRDRETSRYIHRLFWHVILVDWPDFLFWALTRPVALVIYNVLIPVQVAYGLQAIIVHGSHSVDSHATSILLLTGLYCALWGIGGVAICRNARVDTTYIQRQVFKNYLQKDYEFYGNMYVGALGAQAVKLREALSDYAQLFTNSVTQQFVIVVSSVVVIAYHSWVLAATTILLMMMVLSFTIAASKWRLKYRRELSETASETAGVIGDALSHGAIVKSFATEAYEATLLDKSLGRYTSAQHRSWMSSIPADIGRMLLAGAATALLLVLTARLYERHRISIAVVALIQLYVIKLITATQNIADILKAYETIMSSAHQAVKTMLIRPTILDSSDARNLPKGIVQISFANVGYQYDGASSGSFAVKGFDIDIKAGEKVGLVGYSGSGKTTLTKLLLRFMDVSSGVISIGGIDVRDLKQTNLRAHIAYVPQEPLLFHRTIAENIAYGKPGAPARAVRAAAKAAYVDEFVDGLPEGYGTLVGERGIKLSGGQRQRVAIARAILKDAPILVLDEATSALDSRSEKFIQKALWRLMKGRTALVIAHRLSTVQHMDRIVVMDKGCIVQIGTHEELLKASRGIYARLWTHQSGGYIGVSPKSLAS